jgi:ABC-type proline/glycine betaine transport system permease subunit
LRAGELPKALNYLGVVLGVAGILSTIPALFLMLALVFGIGKIVWMIWLGIVMLRSSPSAAA